MAIAQYTQQFLENLPSVNGRSVKEFFETLLKVPVTHRMELISAIIDTQRDYLPFIQWFHGKDDKQSRHFRYIGNQCFERLEYVEALKNYNRALAFAKTSKHLGVCYANRSAVYFELSMYDLCLENIALARVHQLNDAMTSKLDQRHQEATSLLLSKFVPKPHRKYHLQFCRPPKPYQPFFIDCLAKPQNHIITKEPLLPSNVISLEHPYSQVLSHSHVYERCTYCLSSQKKYLSMIPCPLCSSAMFCDNECYGMAMKFFHGLECSMIDGLYRLLTDQMYLGLRTVLVSLNECQGGSLAAYRSMLIRCFNNDADSFDVPLTTAPNHRQFSESVFLTIHNLNRSFKFSMPHHMATAILVDKLMENFGPVFDCDPIVLVASIFHLIQVSQENAVLLEETAFGGDGVGNDIRIYGCGLFPFASKLRIECAPNVLLLNYDGRMSGIALRPIKAGEVIVPGIMSRNHFLTDRHRRSIRMLASNSELCHCIACQDDYELHTEIPPIVPHYYGDLSMVPEAFTNSDEVRVALNSICSYLNRNTFLPYHSREIGWCTQEMIRVFRQMFGMNDTDVIFTEYSKLIRND